MKKTYLFVLMILASITMFADPVSQKTAKAVASQFFASHAIAGAKGTNGNGEAFSSKLSLVNTDFITDAIDAEPAFYIFNAEGQQGYVIVSGDDELPALLGYSLEGAWPQDESLVPTPLKNVLQNYAAYVKAVREGNVDANDMRKTDASATVIVKPLLTTKWNQCYPYNKYAPESDYYTCLGEHGGHIAIGCAAVAFAQVLNYWGQKTGKPACPNNFDTFATFENYHSDKSVTTDTLLYSLSSATKYDFANIPDSIGYRNDTINIMSKEDWAVKSEAVALLLRDVAYALNMSWNQKSGGSSAAESLCDISDVCFGFSKESAFVEVLGYGGLKDTKYLNIIKDNLDKGYPIVARGRDPAHGGHGFVFDGYDSNDFVHINWGWAGSCNNFFDLTYLKTDQYDANKGQEYDFSTDEGMLYNLHPKDESEVETPELNLDNVQLMNAGCYSAGQNDAVVSKMKSIKEGIYQPIAYLNRDTIATKIFLDGMCYHRAFGYDYDIIMRSKCLETGVETVDTIHDTETKNIGRNIGAPDFHRTFTFDPTKLPDGTYVFSGAIREVLNGQTSEWKESEACDTLILKDNHIIFQPLDYGKLYHAKNCIHHIEDAENNILVHMEYNRDPEDIHAGDSLTIIVEMQGITSHEIEFVDNDKITDNTRFILYSDDKPAEDIYDPLGIQQILGTYNVVQQFLRGNAFMSDAFSTSIAFDEKSAGKTYHLELRLPITKEGIKLVNDITVHSATGIDDICDATAPATTRAYNLIGQPVSSSYHGIVIKGGKKIMCRP